MAWPTKTLPTIPVGKHCGYPLLTLEIAVRHEPGLDFHHGLQ